MTTKSSTKAWVVGVEVNGEDFVQLVMTKTLEAAIESAQQMRVAHRGREIGLSRHFVHVDLPSVTNKRLVIQLDLREEIVPQDAVAECAWKRHRIA